MNERKYSRRQMLPMLGLSPFLVQKYITGNPEQQGVKPESLVEYYLDLQIPKVSVAATDNLNRLIRPFELQAEVANNLVLPSTRYLQDKAQRIF